MRFTLRSLAGTVAALLLASCLHACHNSRAVESPQPANPPGRRVLFICDASWTMTDFIDDSLLHLAAEIDKLAPADTFTIIVPRERNNLVFSRDLLPATDDNRRAATEFISTIAPKHQNDFAQALKLISAVKPDLIHLLSDGDFDSEKFLHGLADLNRDKRMRIHATLFALSDQTVEGNHRTEVMKQLAADHRGEFSVIRCPRPHPQP